MGSTFPGRHCVYAPADAARADIERAMLSKDFTKLKIIKDKSLFSDKYEFSSDGRFHSQGMKSSHLRKSGHNRLIQLVLIIIPNYLVPTFVMFKNIDKKLNCEWVGVKSS